jgi:hypothetical protein
VKDIVLIVWLVVVVVDVEGGKRNLFCVLLHSLNLSVVKTFFSFGFVLH